MKKIVDREMRFAHHLARRETNPDTHFLKELVHYDDGTSEPKFHIITDYKRPFWITRPIYRKHKQIKEAEDIDKLDQYSATESDLANEIFRKLKRNKFKKVSMRDVRRSPFAPYVYGADIPASTFMKLEYQEKYNTTTPFSVGFLDIENHPDTKIISVVTFAYRVKDRTKVYTVVNQSEIPNTYDLQNIVIDKLKSNLPNELPPCADFSKLDFDIVSVKDEKETILWIMDKVHKSEIDILAGWNFIYDITEIAKAAERNGIDPKDIFSDPSVPEHLRYFRVVEGRAQRTTQAGKVMSIPVEERWHKFYMPAKFKVIDSMTAYRYIRLQDPKLPGGYSLDNVLKSEGYIPKLELVDMPGMTKKNIHIYMLNKHPIEYVAYNIWDVLALWCKEDKDHDLSISLPMLSGVTDFDKFSSNPSKIYEDFYSFYREENKIIANMLDTDVNEELESLGRTDWTITVDLWRADDTYGHSILSDDYTTNITLDNNNDIKKLQDRGYVIPNNLLRSRVMPLSFDLDITSSYPSCTYVLNVSADTCVRELITIGGYEKETFKYANINLITGVTGYMKYCSEMFNMPTLKELDKIAKDMI